MLCRRKENYEQEEKKDIEIRHETGQTEEEAQVG